MNTYQVPETVRLQATIVDSSGELADPVTVKININGPDGIAIIEAADLEKLSKGIYYYDYDLPADVYGMYRYNIVAVGGEGRITIVKDKFLAEGAF